jgi:hypothetical protein
MMLCNVRYIRPQINRIYVRLNGNSAAPEEVSVSNTVADLYRTSRKHVESMMVLDEHLAEVITEEKNVYKYSKYEPENRSSKFLQ